MTIRSAANPAGFDDDLRSCSSFEDGGLGAHIIDAELGGDRLEAGPDVVTHALAIGRWFYPDHGRPRSPLGREREWDHADDFDRGAGWLG